MGIDLLSVVAYAVLRASMAGDKAIEPFIIPSAEPIPERKPPKSPPKQWQWGCLLSTQGQVRRGELARRGGHPIATPKWEGSREA